LNCPERNEDSYIAKVLFEEERAHRFTDSWSIKSSVTKNDRVNGNYNVSAVDHSHKYIAGQFRV
jgi:hypothetical protein